MGLENLWLVNTLRLEENGVLWGKLPAPPSPHPELSLGNRKFGGSERYQEAQLLLPRDKVRVGGAGWMGDGGAQNPPRLPPGPAARRD